MRIKSGKNALSAAILGRQSVRATRRDGVGGYAAGKKSAGRKHHLLIDTDSMILKVRIYAARAQNRNGAALVLDQIEIPLSKLELIWTDGGDARDKPAGWMVRRFGQCPLRLEIVRRSNPKNGFAVPPRRRVVERTSG